MRRTSSNQSVREQKAEALDQFVKREIARVKAVDAAKAARLRALRLARDEQQSTQVQPLQRRESKPAKRKTSHLRSTR